MDNKNLYQDNTISFGIGLVLFIIAVIFLSSMITSITSIIKIIAIYFAVDYIYEYFKFVCGK